MGPLLALFFGCEKPCAAPLYSSTSNASSQPATRHRHTSRVGRHCFFCRPGLIGGNRSVLTKRRHRGGNVPVLARMGAGGVRHHEPGWPCRTLGAMPSRGPRTGRARGEDRRRPRGPALGSSVAFACRPATPWAPTRLQATLVRFPVRERRVFGSLWAPHAPIGRPGEGEDVTSNRSYSRRRLRSAKRTTRCDPWRRGVGALYMSGRGSCARATRMSGE
jgi:hypothetical protein